MKQRTINPYLAFLAVTLFVGGTPMILAEDKNITIKSGVFPKDSLQETIKDTPTSKETEVTQLRDPFLPWGEIPGKGPPPRPLQLKLKGIILGPKKPLAIVEDAKGTSYIITEKQDLGDGRTITAIRKDRIMIQERSGKIIELMNLETKESPILKP
jgi:hypothetical protein